MALTPHIEPVQQRVQGPSVDHHRVTGNRTRPDELLLFQALAPQTEVVFIKPLYRMWLIDRENTVSNFLSWGVSA